MSVLAIRNNISNNKQCPLFYGNKFYQIFDVAKTYNALRNQMSEDGVEIDFVKINKELYLLQSFALLTFCNMYSDITINDIAVCLGYANNIDAATFDLTQCFIYGYCKSGELEKKVYDILQTTDVSNIILALKDQFLLDSLSCFSNYIEIVKTLDFNTQCEIAIEVYRYSDTDNFISLMLFFPQVLVEMKKKITGLKLGGFEMYGVL